MAEYRRVTRQCADDDWAQCHTHAEVLKRHGSTVLLKQFLKQKPNTWYSGDAPRERRRNLRPGQPAPGKRVIGQVKVTGFRAWVWHDDASVYDIEDDFAGFDLHWMIAYGNRRQGDQSDLQSKRQALLHDPDDTWRPGEDDYADLLGEHDEGFTERNMTAIRHAVERAEREHNTIIDIASGEVGGQLVHEHDEDVVNGVVIEEINERWLLLAHHRHGGRILTYDDALTLVPAAYPDGVYPETVSQKFSIRGDLLTADPATHYVFYAQLP